MSRVIIARSQGFVNKVFVLGLLNAEAGPKADFLECAEQGVLITRGPVFATQACCAIIKGVRFRWFNETYPPLKLSSDFVLESLNLYFGLWRKP